MCLWPLVSQVSIEATSADAVLYLKYVNFLLIRISHLWKSTEQGHFRTSC